MNTIRKNLGGDRIGSGNKINVELHNYSRSTHDLSNLFKTTMAPGTLVPFMKHIALPGDNWEINLAADVMTYPTVGPMFASFKLQLDIFLCPLRLYQGKLHNNALGIGMKMNEVKLPQLDIICNNIDRDLANDITEGVPFEFQQINQASIFSYLGIRGVGRHQMDDPKLTVKRSFNAIPFLSYWDIYKNYYANKQEEIGAVIHTSTDNGTINAALYKHDGQLNWSKLNVYGIDEQPLTLNMHADISTIYVKGNNLIIDNIFGYDNTKGDWNDKKKWIRLSDAYASVNVVADGVKFSNRIPNTHHMDGILGNVRYIKPITRDGINIITFPLTNLDDMRNDLLLDAKKTTPFIVNKDTYEPYGLAFKLDTNNKLAAINPLEGLALKTYQSDIFNNWLSTEWLENEEGTGINQITAVSTQDGNFQIDALILAKKVYDMLNRIAVSGGSYNDWLEAVWAHESYKKAESPIYMGGLSQEVVFQEVISNSATSDEPLGSLAGKGKLTDRKKGGYIEIKVDEPSYIIGIVSLTPRLDYSQGNDWDNNLQTMDDLHKPALDGIGFQELITDNMAFWDTEVNENGAVLFKSAGKQPAWLNYMTNYNKTYGNFADPRSEMFMTLNRRYSHSLSENAINTEGRNEDNDNGIIDLTTYIDPAKFNYMFANVDRNAQNFWVQIANNITARRKMSAKIIPNL